MRALWLALPFGMGPVLADALRDSETTFRTAVSAGAWLTWAAVLLATIVTLPVMLTIVRIAAPATIAIALWAGTDVGFGTAAAIGGVTGALVTVVAFLPTTGAAFIDGASYGSERRLALRTPTALMLGPIELAWVAVVAGISVGPLLLAASVTIGGVVAILIGFPVAAIGFRSLVALSQRWLVFVPAGVVVHDHLALRDPVLLPSQLIDHIGPARADTTATDITGEALGLAIEIGLSDPVKVELTRPDTATGLTPVAGLLVTPSLPAELLEEAEARRLPVA